MSRSGRQGRGFLPDTAPGVPAADGSASREASARAAAQDAASGTPAAVRTTITVPESVSMVALLAQADELLRLVEAEVEADIHVRGNEIAVTGQPADNAFAVRIFDELIALLGTRQELRPDSVRRVIAMLKSGGCRRAGPGLAPHTHNPRGPPHPPPTR